MPSAARTEPNPGRFAGARLGWAKWLAAYPNRPPDEQAAWEPGDQPGQASRWQSAATRWIRFSLGGPVTHDDPHSSARETARPMMPTY